MRHLPLLVCLVVLTAWSAGPATAQEPPPAQSVLREVVVEGASVFSQGEIRRWLDLRVDAPLPNSTAVLAKDVQSRYEQEGYAAARIDATFDEATGRLVLTIDEGRIDAVEFEGLDVDVARRLADRFDIRPGQIFNQREVRRALRRLIEATGGAIQTSSDWASGGFQLQRLVDTGDRPFGMVDRDGKRVLVINLKPRRGRVSMTFGTDGREDWFSPVDGFTPAIGFHVTSFDQKKLNHTVVSGFVSYKYARSQTGYSLGFERPWFNKLYFGAEVHDLTGSDDGWRLSTGEQSLAVAGFHRSFRDYYDRRGYQAHIAFRPHPTHELFGMWRAERHETLVNDSEYSLFRRDDAHRPNRPILDGELHGWLFGYSWDSRGFETETPIATYGRHMVDHSFGTLGSQLPGWRVEWTTELAVPDTHGGTFDFSRHILNARRYTRLSPYQSVSARAVMGWSDGSLPPQRQFALGGIGSVRGYSFKEAIGEGMFLANVEYKLNLARAWRDASGAGLRGVAFFDAGRVSRPSVGSRDEWLKGAGVGLEVGDSFRVDFGWRLDAIPNSLQVLVRLRPAF